MRCANSPPQQLPNPLPHYAARELASDRARKNRRSIASTVPLNLNSIGITDQIYYRWRKEYGGIRTDQAKQLKDLAKFNTDFGDRFCGHIVPGVPPTPGGSGPISGRRTGQCPLFGVGKAGQIRHVHTPGRRLWTSSANSGLEIGVQSGPTSGN